MKRVAIVLTLAMACFALTVVNSNRVLADAQHDLIEKKVRQTNRIVKGKAHRQKLIDGRYQIKQIASVPFIYAASTTFPIIINQPGSYVLTSDLFVSTDVDAISITADDVTLDLNGFSLVGPDSGTIGSGIRIQNYSNVEIKNGTVRDFANDGIGAGYTTSTQIRLINIRAISNGQDGIDLFSTDNLITHCTASQNGTDGIHTLPNSIVTGCTAYLNTDKGIFAGSDCVVTNNTVLENRTGIHFTSGTIAGNTVSSNREFGILGTEYSSVVGNTVKDNNTSGQTGSGEGGIWVDHDCLVKRNVVGGNQQHNIFVNTDDNAIEENLVTDCTLGNGINFAGGGNFYDNNRARGNATNYNDPGGNTNGGGNVSF